MNQPRGLLKLLKLDSLINTVIDYVETRIGLIRAEVKDNIMIAIRAAAIYGAIAVLGLFFVIFFSITLGLVLNAVLNSSFWGFVIVTGIYLIALVVLFSLRNSEKVKNMIGDGSLAFLKKDTSQQEDKEKNEQEQEEIEREEAIREKQSEMEHGKVTFDRKPASRSGAVIVDGKVNGEDRRNAEIKVEKKEDAQ